LKTPVSRAPCARGWVQASLLLTPTWGLVSWLKDKEDPPRSGKNASSRVMGASRVFQVDGQVHIVTTNHFFKRKTEVQNWEKDCIIKGEDDGNCLTVMMGWFKWQIVWRNAYEETDNTNCKRSATGRTKTETSSKKLKITMTSRGQTFKSSNHHRRKWTKHSK